MSKLDKLTRFVTQPQPQPQSQPQSQPQGAVPPTAPASASAPASAQPVTQPDTPEQFADLDSVSVRITLPGHIAAAILRDNPDCTSIEAATLDVLRRAVLARATPPSSRPLYFDDAARRALEAELDVNVFTPAEVIRRVATLRRISIAGTEVPLPQMVLERLDSRRTGGTLAEYIIETTTQLLRNHVRL
jgi:hypothetical protein